jgi:hypothetical protein
MSHAAQLVPAIEELLDGFKVFQSLKQPYVQDSDKVRCLYDAVYRYAILAGFDPEEVPSLEDAEIQLGMPGTHPPYPNRGRAQSWVQMLRDLQTQARAKTAGVAPATGDAPAPRTKRSTERGEGRAKLIAALTKHHQYADGGCLNLEPIGNNELARLARVSESTASAFFKSEFKGLGKYRAICRDAGRLADSLKALNNEFSPHDLYGRRPADEDDRDDDG